MEHNKSEKSLYLKENATVLFIVFFIVSMVAVFLASKVDNYFIQKELKSKMKDFNNGHPFICARTIFDTKYLISKETDWYLLGNNITNGEIVYKLEECSKGDQRK